MIPYTQYHLLQCLDKLDLKTTPDNFIRAYFRNNKALGSKDRRWISSQFYTILRHKLLLDFFLKSKGKEVTSINLVQLLQDFAIEDILKEAEAPWHIEASISQDLANLLIEDYGEEKAKALARIFLSEAPIALRINDRRVSIEQFKSLFPDYNFIDSEVENCLKILTRYPLQHTKEYALGYFEFQDESSQKASLEVPIHSDQTVLDFCAGGGGKSLIFVRKAKHVFLHDNRQDALSEAKQRLLRSGYKNFSFLANSQEKTFDVVVIDAPCSGSGTFRRHPEQKWRFSLSSLKKRIALQQSLIQEAEQYVNPQGMLVYITCSILKAENEKQIEFLNSRGWKVKKQVTIPLVENGGDGFFIVCCCR